MNDPKVEVCEPELCVSLELSPSVPTTLRCPTALVHQRRATFCNAELFTAFGDHMVGTDGECLTRCPGCTIERGSGAFRVTR